MDLCEGLVCLESWVIGLRCLIVESIMKRMRVRRSEGHGGVLILAWFETDTEVVTEAKTAIGSAAV